MAPVTARFIAPIVVVNEHFVPLLNTPATDPDQNPPLAGIDAAGNVRFNSASKIQATRWIPSAAKVLSSYYIKVKSDIGDGSSYTGGTGGSMLARLCGETVDNKPDLTNVISSVNVGPLSVANPNTSQNGVQIDFNHGVSAGQAYWIVISNNDADPVTNYFSQNYAYVNAGMSGANATNQTDGTSPNLYYGLDPRELVAGSGDGGVTWNIPGDAVSGGVLTKHIPTYIAKYSDNTFQAQPYYSATTPSNGSKTVTYQGFPGNWTLSSILVWTNGNTNLAGTGAIQVLLNDVLQTIVTVAGSGFLRASLNTPLAVLSTDVLKFTFPVFSSGGPSGLALLQQYADSYFDGILSLGSSYKFYASDTAARMYAVMPQPSPYAVGPYSFSSYQNALATTVAGTSALSTDLFDNPETVTFENAGMIYATLLSV